MLVRLSCSSIQPPRPRSFAGLMEMYEANYMRFRRLCPELYNVGDGAVSRARGALDLHLRVLGRSSYTSTVHLTYYLKDRNGLMCPNPDLRLRIYHDALQAEVLGCSWRCLPEKMRSQVIGFRTELAGKWAVNRFLYKWLRYCLRQGHAFPGDAVAQTSQQRSWLHTITG
jgi:uncharacterized protein YqiB (DUF1249 family)